MNYLLKRIRDIFAELGMEEVVEDPKLKGSEVPESVLKVEDAEVTAEKYVSSGV